MHGKSTALGFLAATPSSYMREPLLQFPGGGTLAEREDGGSHPAVGCTDAWLWAHDCSWNWEETKSNRMTRLATRNSSALGLATHPLLESCFLKANVFTSFHSSTLFSNIYLHVLKLHKYTTSALFFHYQHYHIDFLLWKLGFCQLTSSWLTFTHAHMYTHTNTHFPSPLSSKDCSLTILG